MDRSLGLQLAGSMVVTSSGRSRVSCAPDVAGTSGNTFTIGRWLTVRG